MLIKYLKRMVRSMIYWKRRKAPHLGWFTSLFTILLVSIGLYSWFSSHSSYLPQMGGSTAVAIISGLTVGLGVHRLRRPSDSELPSVKQTFSRSNNSDKIDFGLKNYGNGAAHYIQIKVTEANSEEAIFKVKPRDPPVHLEEDEFFGFIYDDRVSGKGLLDGLKSEQRTDEMLHIHYSYMSSLGSRAPPEAHAERDDEYVLDDFDGRAKENPRRMKIDAIVSYCDDGAIEKPTTFIENE